MRAFSRILCSGPSLVNVRLKSGSSSHDWLQRQAKDPFVRKAKESKYRARSAFKLIAIDDKYKFLLPGALVVDCGAAPGSWSQVASERTNADRRFPNKPNGQVIAIDLQPIYPLAGVTVHAPADFTLPSTLEKILQLSSGRQIDVVLSDMSPRASGAKRLDQEASLTLCQSALNFAVDVLPVGRGSFVCKMLTGGDTPSFMKCVKEKFEFASFVKPEASRNDSSEIFVFARQKR